MRLVAGHSPNALARSPLRFRRSCPRRFSRIFCAVGDVAHGARTETAFRIRPCAPNYGNVDLVESSLYQPHDETQLLLIVGLLQQVTNLGPERLPIERLRIEQEHLPRLDLE